MITDAWENWESRRTLGGISATWPGIWSACCNEGAPTPDAECSREVGHPGRHMASLGAAFGHRIVAAWPGSHPPTKADLVTTTTEEYA